MLPTREERGNARLLRIHHEQIAGGGMGRIRGRAGERVSAVRNRHSRKRYGIVTARDPAYQGWTTSILPIIPTKVLFGLVTLPWLDSTHPIVTFLRAHQAEAYAFHAQLCAIVTSTKEEEWFAVLPPAPPLRELL